ncbi:MAG: AMIN domain-containing protein, partial [Desulfuromonadales bacterium]|nr:AMIN domain-containing protein [Desulfuromonadales bacterium]
MHGVKFMAQNSRRQGAWRFCQIAMLSFLLSTVLQVGSVAVADASNRLLLADLDEQAESLTVLLRTSEPVGYRYTVYDSADPVRVVVDFPDMEIGDVAEAKTVEAGVVSEIRASRLGLASGNLARVEILLARSSEYQISLDGTEFRIVFAPSVAEPAPQADAANVVASVTPTAVAEPAAQAATAPASVNQVPLAAAANLTQLTVTDGQAVVTLDGRPTVYREFTLTNPSRLVVDVLDVKPTFRERSFPAGEGFQQVRVGVDKVKTRLV